MRKKDTKKNIGLRSILSALRQLFGSRNELKLLVQNQPLVEPTTCKLAPEEWATAIIIAYNSGNGLTETAKAELREEVKDAAFLAEIHKVLVDEGYGSVFGLTLS